MNCVAVWARRLAIGIGGLAIALAVILTLAFAWARSDGGRERIARGLESLLSTPGSEEIAIGRLEGQLPAELTLVGLEVRDAEGTWLRAGTLDLRWNPWDLLTGTLRVEVLALDALTIDRAPVSPPSETEAPSEFALPSLPFEVVLDRLAVETLTLNEAVLGSPAALRIEATASIRKSNDLLASLLVERSDGTPGRIQGKMAFELAERRLTLDIAASEPPGGLIVRALQLPDLPALEASLKGAGPLDGWRGALEFELAELAWAKADLELAGLEDLAFQLSGEAGAAAALTELPWPLLSPEARFLAKGSWRDAGTLQLDQMQVTSGAGEVSLQGSIDTASSRLDLSLAGSLEENRLASYLPRDAKAGRVTFESAISGSLEEAEVTLHIAADSLAMADATARGIVLDAKASGPLVQPELHAELRAEAIETAQLTADAVSARLEFQPDAPLDEGSIGGPFQTAGTIVRPQLLAAPELQSLIGEAVGWSTDGRLEPSPQVLHLEQLQIAADQVALTGDGRLDLESEAATARLRLDLRDLGALSDLLQIEVKGDASVETKLSSNDLKQGLNATVSGELRNLAIAEPFAQALIENRLSLDAELSLDPSGTLAVENILAGTPHMSLQGKLHLLEDFAKLEADYALEIPDLAVLESPAGMTLAGVARLHGSAKGTAADPSLAGRLELVEALVEGQKFAHLTLDYSAKDLGREPHGKLTALAATPIGEVAAHTDYRLQDDLLHLKEFGVEAGKTRATGQGVVPLNGEPIDAGIELSAPDLAPWLKLGGLSGTGAVEAKLKLFGSNARQSASLEAGAQGIGLAQEGGDRLSVSRVDVNLAGSDLLGEPKAEGKISAGGLRLGELMLDRLTLEGSGDPAGGALKLDTKGNWIEPLELRATAEVAKAGDTLKVEVAELQGKGLGQDLRSLQRAQLEFGPEILGLSGLDLAIGSASLKGSARLSADTLAADIQLADLPMSALQPLWSGPNAAGRISGTLALSGTAKAPTGQLSLAVADLKADLSDESQPLNLGLTGDWRDGRLQLDGALEGLGSEAAAFSARLPLRPDPPGFVPQVPPDGPVSGQLRWNGKIEEVWPLVPIVGQELGGQGNLELELAGRVDRPLLTGRVAIADGTYENLQTGTLLREIELAALLDGDKVTLSKLEASDGGEGRLSMTGGGVLDPAAEFPFSLEGELSALTLMRRDDLTAASDGKLTLGGSLTSVSLAGQFKTRGVEIRIPDRLPAQVVDLEVTEASQELALAPPSQEPAAQGGMDLDLDLTLDMPDRVFVRGRGLDSEWAGRLEARGTPEEPDLKGKLKLVRGKLSLMGKDFNLERGTIDFLGGKTIDPFIDIEALAQTKDIAVTLGLTGTASNPEIVLSSVPVLPRDEIVARLLFGKGTTQLSALEAAQLAAAVAELTGADGGGPSVFDMVRGTLGVDVLRVETASSGDSALSVGKYVTDGVYVGVTRGAAAETGAMAVEVELTPNISVESKVGETGESNIGVKFKWDY